MWEVFLPNPFSLIDKTNFFLALISDLSSLDLLPFFFILSVSITDRETIWSFGANSIPLIPFDDLPLNTLNFFASNLIHLPKLVLKIISRYNFKY